MTSNIRIQSVSVVLLRYNYTVSQKMLKVVGDVFLLTVYVYVPGA